MASPVAARVQQVYTPTACVVICGVDGRYEWKQLETTDGGDTPMRYRTARLASALLSFVLLVAACSGPGQGQTGGGSQSPGGQERKGGVLRVSTLGSLPKILHP